MSFPYKQKAELTQCALYKIKKISSSSSISIITLRYVQQRITPPLWKVENKGEGQVILERPQNYQYMTLFVIQWMVACERGMMELSV